jgi:hypothetical protein
MNNTNNYIDLPHRYLLETDIEAVFDSYKDDLPVVLGLLQDNNEIKGYSLDNCAAMGSKGSGYNADGGFIKGRVTFKVDRYIDIGRIMKRLDQERENTNDRK